MTTPQFDPNLLAYLQAWRQYLEQLAGAATVPAVTVPGMAFPGLPTVPVPPSPMAPPALPPLPTTVMPPSHPASYPATAPATPSPDYIQQLLDTLQAWRHYLETSMRTAPVPSTPAPTEGTPPTEQVVVTPAPAPTERMLRVGSAYPPESTATVQEGYVVSAPKSLYSAAAQPASSPTTPWWQAGSGTASPTSSTTASKAGYQPPTDEEQTQQTGPSEDQDDGSRTGVTAPDKLERVAPFNPDVAHHSALELIQPSFNLSR